MTANHEVQTYSVRSGEMVCESVDLHPKAPIDAWQNVALTVEPVHSAIADLIGAGLGIGLVPATGCAARAMSTVRRTPRVT